MQNHCEIQRAVWQRCSSQCELSHDPSLLRPQFPMCQIMELVQSVAFRGHSSCFTALHPCWEQHSWEATGNLTTSVWLIWSLSLSKASWSTEAGGPEAAVRSELAFRLALAWYWRPKAHIMPQAFLLEGIRDSASFELSFLTDRTWGGGPVLQP